MRRLALVIAVACGIAPAGAGQTAPADAFPLQTGNAWLFFDREEVLYPGGGESALAGTTDWRVVGTTEIDGAVVPLLEISRNGQPGVTCAVQSTPSGAGVLFELLSADGAAPCAPAGYVTPYTAAAQTGFYVHPEQASVQPRGIGGFTYAGLTVYEGLSYPSESDGGSWVLAEGVGPIRLREYVETEPFVELGRVSTLRRAEVGGETFGAPLDQGGAFFAPGPGDVWVYEAYRFEGSAPVLEAVVTWSAVATADGVALRVDASRGGVAETLGVCPVSVTLPERATYWHRTIAFDCDIEERFALPYVRLLGGEARGVSVGAYRPGLTFTIGGADYVADEGSGSASDQPSGKPSRLASWRVARDIGVTEFTYVAPLSGDVPGFLSVLRYAEVGGVAYGSRPVAATPPPRAHALTITVGPNPARSSARLVLRGAAEVRVTVLDALGRTVQTRDATPGALTLDTSRWASGVYTVRAESAGGVATARLTVAR